MTSKEKRDISRMRPGALDQIGELRGLAADDPSVISAAQTAARLRALAREAAKGLPFETDPTNFERLFGSLARIPDPHD